MPFPKLLKLTQEERSNFFLISDPIFSLYVPLGIGQGHTYGKGVLYSNRLRTKLFLCDGRIKGDSKTRSNYHYILPVDKYLLIISMSLMDGGAWWATYSPGGRKELDMTRD